MKVNSKLKESKWKQILNWRNQSESRFYIKGIKVKVPTSSSIIVEVLMVIIRLNIFVIISVVIIGEVKRVNENI